MVRRVGWGGSRGRPGRWGDLGPGSVPLLPISLPPLPPPPCRGLGRGRISIFSLSPAPHTRSSPSPLALGPPCPAMQAPGTSHPCHSALPTRTTQAQPVTTPISAPPSWGSQSTPPLASVTPPPTRRCPQDPPGLRIGPLIPEQDYERLEDCDPEGSQDSPLHGEEQQPLLHVPEGLRGSWHHIQNLDSFFTKIYSYHQRNGFACILLEDVFQLGQFVFIVTFTTFLLRCVDYNILFAKQPNNRTRPGLLHSKVTLADAILSSSQCAQRIRSSPLLVFLLILAAAFWLLQLLRSVCNLFSYWDIQVFYREALHIPPEELSSVPWAEVQSRLLALQKSGGLCVQPRPLTELDVHHRILRYTNYKVALANKGLLPARCALPWGGSAAFLSHGLALNVDLLLFRGPFSLFRGGWELPDAYKRSDQRGALAARWRRTVLLLAAMNLALSPLVLAWQVLHAFYSHAELLRREPGALGARRWSRLAHLQLRHFNELPHELRARLARAYRPAAAFLRAAAPPAPLLALLARQLVFFAGALFAALLVLTVYDEDVLAVEHVLTAMTALGVTATVARSFIPEEQGGGRSPQLLLQAALAHMHYLPEEPGPAGRASAYRQMARLLQYRAVSLLEELLSPLLTPLFLLFWFCPRSLEIIDFFHHFTVDVAGVGDICSFALMDVKRHGHPQWLSAGQTEASQSQRAEDGKTELSLMRFSLVHPQWRPPGHSSKFLGQLRGRVQQDAAAWGATSVRSPPTPGVLSDSSSPLPEAFLANLLAQPLLPPRDLSPTAPCPAAATASLLASISRLAQDPSCVSPGGTGGQKLAQLPELASAEMSLHAIYLHQLHQQQQQELWGEASASSLSRPWSSPSQTLSPDEEKPSWSSDGSSPASSPRQQWRTQRTENLLPGRFQETTDTQKEPGQAPGTD
ncbi:autophagy-related protein 9B isoform X3 [Canis lupus baileyi]|uniref:Autophagy-related protein 9 n=2 Tax=Canis lupus familiaris TaxID=9615 RepID=A0A8C0PF30_CANLF|nr:autophagy-related protein 9B [Canis lupus familiaris]XP_038415644.1 autophagy-related protein 9B [Canis lupus familiaris]XP_038545404.1 autophagy-related protein 9B [Canis lupus familiaris]XP_048950877.1 autophagy-related protein 9B isoform X2 [Canis lupus dingo]